jgi:hypothetical protein
MADQEYVKAIDSLIPQAVKLANELVPDAKRAANMANEKWDRVFHGEMKRLTVLLGLRVP